MWRSLCKGRVDVLIKTSSIRKAGIKITLIWVGLSKVEALLQVRIIPFRRRRGIANNPR